mmetsp:Transcript_25670/g.48572  ORF Transcript_25670/g.48572 Transcript_25670/m.48572 type:complete len:208 (-) Transcript_25670:622-1245(-)
MLRSNITVSAMSSSTSERRMEDAFTWRTSTASSSDMITVSSSCSALLQISWHGVRISCISLRSNASFWDAISFCLSSMSRARSFCMICCTSDRRKHQAFRNLPSTLRRVLMSSRRGMASPPSTFSLTDTADKLSPAKARRIASRNRSWSSVSTNSARLLPTNSSGAMPISSRVDLLAQITAPLSPTQCRATGAKSRHVIQSRSASAS